VRRREFIAGLGGAAAWSLAARAQQAGKPYRIGWLHPQPIPDDWQRGFSQGLREYDYVEGKNLILEKRWGDGNFDRLPAMAAELVDLDVDVIISGNTTGLLALQKLTHTIPIVMLGPGDPLAVGLVASLARPGGNITGLSLMAVEVSGKRLQLLKEVVPRLVRIMVLSNPGNPAVVLGLQETLAAAQALGLTLKSLDMRVPDDLDRVLSVIVKERPDALFLPLDSMINSQRTLIAEFAVKHRLPSISPFPEFATAGGLMAYGPNVPDIHLRAVGYIDKLIRGTKPADLPVQQPTKFDLAANVKTAKALGLTIPETLLAAADEVIQ
jgi:putative ABC transport system substrate-binding protein